MRENKGYQMDKQAMELELKRLWNLHITAADDFDSMAWHVEYCKLNRIYEELFGE